MIMYIIFRSDFQHWDWLDSCMGLMAAHPRVSDKMKLRNTPEYHSHTNIYTVLRICNFFCTDPDPTLFFSCFKEIEVFIYRRPTLYPLEIAVDFLKSL
jgi:hypothetical protein